MPMEMQFTAPVQQMAASGQFVQAADQSYAFPATQTGFNPLAELGKPEQQFNFGEFMPTFQQFPEPVQECPKDNEMVGPVQEMQFKSAANDSQFI